MRGLLALLFTAFLATGGDPAAAMKSFNPEEILHSLENTLQSGDFNGLKLAAQNSARSFKESFPSAQTAPRTLNVFSSHKHLKLSAMKSHHGAHAASPRKRSLKAL